MKYLLMACVAMLTCTAWTFQAQADLVGYWNFEDAGNLTAAQVGSDLVLTGSQAAVAGSGGPDTGAASLGNGDFYTATNPIGVNGGGATKTNEYTILMDINTSSTDYNALLDQDGGGDGDFFIRGDGGIGISGDYAGVVNDGDWHRLVIVYDLNGTASGAMTRYIDGALVSVVAAADDTIDGRFGLDATFTAFSDNGGGEEDTTAVSNLALFDTALSSDQVIALGGAGRLIPIPEPASLALAMLSAASLAVSRRRKIA